MGACMNSKESKKNPVAAFFGAIGKFFKEFGEAAAKGDGAVKASLLVAGAGTAVIGVRIDADPSTGCEEPRHLDILRVHHADQILHDDIDAVLVESPVVAEGEEVDL